MGEEFTHLTDSGVHMVEVGAKPDQKRRAIASGKIFLDESTIKMIQAEEIKKASESELLEIAADNGIDVKSYVF